MSTQTHPLPDTGVTILKKEWHAVMTTTTTMATMLMMMTASRKQKKRRCCASILLGVVVWLCTARAHTPTAPRRFRDSPAAPHKPCPTFPPLPPSVRSCSAAAAWPLDGSANTANDTAVPTPESKRRSQSHPRPFGRNGDTAGRSPPRAADRRDGPARVRPKPVLGRHPSAGRR